MRHLFLSWSKRFSWACPYVEVGNEWCFDIEKMRVQSSNCSFCSHERSLLHGDNQVFSLRKWVTLVWCAVTVSFTTFPQKYLIHCPLKFKSSVAHNIVGHMAPEHGVNCFNMCSAQCFRKPNSAEQLVILFGQFCVVDATFFSLWISFASTGHLFSLRIMLWWIVCYIKPFVRKSGPLKYVLTHLSSITRKRHSRITGVT